MSVATFHRTRRFWYEMANSARRFWTGCNYLWFAWDRLLVKLHEDVFSDSTVDLRFGLFFSFEGKLQHVGFRLASFGGSRTLNYGETEFFRTFFEFFRISNVILSYLQISAQLRRRYLTCTCTENILYWCILSVGCLFHISIIRSACTNSTSWLHLS